MATSVDRHMPLVISGGSPLNCTSVFFRFALANAFSLSEHVFLYISGFLCSVPGGMGIEKSTAAEPAEPCT